MQARVRTWSLFEIDYWFSPLAWLDLNPQDNTTSNTTLNVCNLRAETQLLNLTEICYNQVCQCSTLYVWMCVHVCMCVCVCICLYVCMCCINCFTEKHSINWKFFSSPCAKNHRPPRPKTSALFNFAMCPHSPPCSSPWLLPPPLPHLL